MMAEDRPKGEAVTCRGCGLYIEWVKTKAGKWMPIDPEGVTVVTREGEVVKGFIPHWATCKDANKFRKEVRK